MRAPILTKINKDGPIPKHAPQLGKCWMWEGAKQGDGYGTASMDNMRILVHRLTFALYVGPINGLQILHKCDNPSCCRPGHLFAGTASSNMQDMWNKNRHARPVGRKNNHAKLTDADVIEIRSRYAQSGVMQEDLAKEFGVSQSSIGNVVLRKTWKFI